MKCSTFSFPTTTVYGAGALRLLLERLPGLSVKRPLVVTDAGVAGSSTFEILRTVLGPGGEGRDWFVHNGVRANPAEADVRAVAEAFGQGGCDGVIGFGGGSVLDAAKASRLLIHQPDLSLEAFRPDAEWPRLAPFVAIPTTAGTGSEVGRSSVITLGDKGRKTVLFHPHLLADLVLLDPEVTRALPRRLTAATGLDALTHCIEAFTSPVFHPLCDGIALEGIHLISEALPRAVREGNDLDARGKMLVAAAMGAIAFQKDLGATHSLAHPLSSKFGLHHGTANALCLAAVMKHNARRRPGLYRRVGLACGLDVVKSAEADRLTIEWIDGFVRGFGLGNGLRQFGVEEKDLEALSLEAWEDPCHLTNPVPVTREDLRELYRACL